MSNSDKSRDSALESSSAPGTSPDDYTDIGHSEVEPLIRTHDSPRNLVAESLETCHGGSADKAPYSREEGAYMHILEQDPRLALLVDIPGQREVYYATAGSKFARKPASDSARTRIGGKTPRRVRREFERATDDSAATISFVPTAETPLDIPQPDLQPADEILLNNSQTFTTETPIVRLANNEIQPHDVPFEQWTTAVKNGQGKISISLALGRKANLSPTSYYWLILSGGRFTLMSAKRDRPLRKRDARQYLRNLLSADDIHANVVHTAKAPFFTWIGEATAKPDVEH